MINTKSKLELIFDCGLSLIGSRKLGYDEKRSHFTQPYYFFLAGFINIMNVKSVIEIGTHKGGSANAMAISNEDLNLVTIDTNEYEMAANRLDGLQNCRRLIGNPLYFWNYRKIKKLVFKAERQRLMFIDAKKNGPWIEKVIKKYSFFEPDFILIDDITFDNEMSRWWTDFSSRKKNAINVVDYLGRDVRNSRQSDKNLNCGFGLISKDVI